MARGFEGFPEEATTFLADLEQNNDRDWFRENKARFELTVLDPAREFVSSVDEALAAHVPKITAIPQVDKSIFRFHRDTRFSKDKTPFKTHLAIFFWEGDAKKLECPGFYFHMEKDRLMLGGGLHVFTREQLEGYRNLVADSKSGGRFQKILETTQGKFNGCLSSDAYKRVPRGYEQDHPRSELLRLKGVTVGEENALPKALFTPRAVDHVMARFEKMLPLHKLLAKMVQGIS